MLLALVGLLKRGVDLYLDPRSRGQPVLAQEAKLKIDPLALRGSLGLDVNLARSVDTDSLEQPERELGVGA